MDNHGGRPLCFNSSLQEFAFVLTATLATAQTSLFGGLVVCMTSHIANDLDMSIAEVTWLSAAQASVSLLESRLCPRRHQNNHCDSHLCPVLERVPLRHIQANLDP